MNESRLALINTFHCFMYDLAQQLDCKLFIHPVEFRLFDTTNKQESTLKGVATNLFAPPRFTTSDEIGDQHTDYIPQGPHGVHLTLPDADAKGEGGLKFSSVVENGKLQRTGQLAPLLLSAVIYVVPEAWQEEFGLGTYFIDKEGKKTRIPCRNGRVVLFDGSIQHGKCQDSIPEKIRALLFRLSLVWTFGFYPNDTSPKQRSLDARLRELLHAKKDISSEQASDNAAQT